MKFRLIIAIAVLALVAVACDGDDAELSSDSTIVTGGTNAPATSTTTADPVDNGSEGESAPSTLVGQTVSEFEVVARFPNDNGETRFYVIPSGAYTDVDLENFIITLVENDGELYGAEVFDSVEAADAFQVEEADRTEEEAELLDLHWFVTLEGRDQIIYRGPFSEFAGGAIGS